MMIEIANNIIIHESEISFDFIRASGPGGQNVNKVATAVQLRFDVNNSPNLTDDIKERLKKIAGRKITEKGILIIEARRFRTQLKNRQDAIERLIALIQKSIVPHKIRRPTKPSSAAKQLRLKSKHHRAQIKKSRRPIKDINDE